MRTWQSGSIVTEAGPAAMGYPGPSDRHPHYMYGRFAPGAPRGRVDELLLGLREAPAAAELPVHPHHHPDFAAKGGRAFMFGVDPEQAPTVVPVEPAYFFWDVSPL